MHHSGGSCAALFGENQDEDVNYAQKGSGTTSQNLNFRRKRNPFSANVFGSICYTVQHGKFTEDFNDLTRLDARLDFASVPAFIKGMSHLLYDAFRGPVEQKPNTLASPRLTLIVQQQVNVLFSQILSYLSSFF